MSFLERERYVVVTSCVCAWWTELKTNECEALGEVIKRLGTLVTLGETRFSSNLSVDYVGQVTQGQWHKAKLNTRITLLECLGGAYCRRHRQITTLNTESA